MEEEFASFLIGKDYADDFRKIAWQIVRSMDAGQKFMVIPVCSESDRKYMEKNRRYDDKMNFVRNIGAVMSMSRERITGCELIDDDTVVVTYMSGYTKEINIACDSYIAIMQDILRQIEL